MSTLNVANIQATGETASRAVSGVAAAWVNADAAASINNSFNVSSGTDHGTGDYSFALSNAFTGSLDYAMSAKCRTTSIDRRGNRNSSRDSASVLASETGDAGTNTNTDQSIEIVATGDLV